MPEPHTFAALLTPPGRGALATIELQGPRAWEIAQACLMKPIPAVQMSERRPWLRQFRSSSGLSEELVVSFPAENAARVHCHGGSAASEAVLAALEAAGATRSTVKRPSFAEALTERTALILLDQEQGAFDRELEAIRELLKANSVSEAQQRIADLMARAPLGRHLTEPWKVVIAGRPNAGKSSLQNALLGFQRSITSSQPGTTRDVVTAITAFDGWPVELRDTAGLRESSDSIEAAGVAIARREIQDADLVLLLIPANEESTETFDLGLACRTLVVRSKADLANPSHKPSEDIAVSAITSSGLDSLMKRIAALLVPFAVPAGTAVPINDQQISAIQRAREYLDRFEAAQAIESLLGATKEAT